MLLYFLQNVIVSPIALLYVAFLFFWKINQYHKRSHNKTINSTRAQDREGIVEILLLLLVIMLGSIYYIMGFL